MYDKVLVSIDPMSHVRFPECHLPVDLFLWPTGLHFSHSLGRGSHYYSLFLWIWLSQILHVSKAMWHLPFCVWLISVTHCPSGSSMMSHWQNSVLLSWVCSIPCSWACVPNVYWVWIWCPMFSVHAPVTYVYTSLSYLSWCEQEASSTLWRTCFCWKWQFMLSFSSIRVSSLMALILAS